MARVTLKWVEVTAEIGLVVTDKTWNLHNKNVWTANQTYMQYENSQSNLCFHTIIFHFVNIMYGIPWYNLSQSLYQFSVYCQGPSQWRITLHW